MKLKAELAAIFLIANCAALPLRANEGKAEVKTEVNTEVKTEVKTEAVKLDGPDICKEDADKFCKDMKPGDGKWGPCLKEHKEKLSEVCRQAVETMGGASKKADEPAMKAADACKSDADKFCKGMNPGDGKFGPCLKEHKEEVSQGCKEAMKSFIEVKHEKMEGTKKKIDAACSDDAQKFCAGMKPGDGKYGPCMKEHKDQLSEGCKKTFGEMKGKMGGPKKD